MDICFEGIGQMVATFATGEALAPGVAVTLKDSGTVAQGKDGEPLCGVTVGAARGGVVAVQIGGVVKVDCSAWESPNVGYAALVCDEKGGVKSTAETGGTKFLVLAVGEDKKSVVVKL